MGVLSINKNNTQKGVVSIYANNASSSAKYLLAEF